jgi:hypothetical protein
VVEEELLVPTSSVLRPTMRAIRPRDGAIVASETFALRSYPLRPRVKKDGVRDGSIICKYA